MSVLEEKHKSLSSDIDNLEQYLWRNCLVLHGVSESNNENTIEILIKTFPEDLGVKTKENDLDRSHRLGKPKRKDNKPWPITVKFAHYAVRKEVFMNKNKLKGKRLLLNESYGVTIVWTSDGRVMVKENNKVFLYKS